jgi:hypothetical protein
MLVILATQKVEIGRILVQGQPRQKVLETTSQPIKAGRNVACLSFQLCRKSRVVAQAQWSISMIEHKGLEHGLGRRTPA